MFDSASANASNKYGEFVLVGLSQGARQKFGMGTREGRLLGDDAFADEALRQVEEKPTNKVSMDEVIAEVCRNYRISEATFSAAGKVRPASEARAVAALLVREMPQLSMTELAKRTGREVSAISQAARRLEIAAKERKFLEQTIGLMLTNLQMSTMTR